MTQQLLKSWKSQFYSCSIRVKKKFAISVTTLSLWYLNLNPNWRMADETMEVFISFEPNSLIIDDMDMQSSVDSL